LNILLDGILGEEVRLLHINHIDIVKKFDNEHLNKSTDIKYLDSHLKILLKIITVSEATN